MSLKICLKHMDSRKKESQNEFLGQLPTAAGIPLKSEAGISCRFCNPSNITHEICGLSALSTPATKGKEGNCEAFHYQATAQLMGVGTHIIASPTVG